MDLVSVSLEWLWNRQRTHTVSLTFLSLSVSRSQQVILLCIVSKQTAWVIQHIRDWMACFRYEWLRDGWDEHSFGVPVLFCQGMMSFIFLRSTWNQRLPSRKSSLKYIKSWKKYGFTQQSTCHFPHSATRAVSFLLLSVHFIELRVAAFGKVPKWWGPGAWPYGQGSSNTRQAYINKECRR